MSIRATSLLSFCEDPEDPEDPEDSEDPEDPEDPEGPLVLSSFRVIACQSNRAVECFWLRIYATTYLLPPADTAVIELTPSPGEYPHEPGVQPAGD